MKTSMVCFNHFVFNFRQLFSYLSDNKFVKRVYLNTNEESNGKQLIEPIETEDVLSGSEEEDNDYSQLLNWYLFIQII